MLKQTAASRKRRDRIIKICESLPEASVRSGGQHAKATVRGRTFAYYLFDHHGDGIEAMSCRAPPGGQDMLVRMDPGRYFVPSYSGPKGWIGQRLDLGDVDWDETRRLIVDSYRLVAPKTLAAMVDAPP